MSGYFLDDLKPGDAFTSPCVKLSEQDVIEFAKIYDPHHFISIGRQQVSHISEGLWPADFRLRRLRGHSRRRRVCSQVVRWPALALTGFVGAGLSGLMIL